MVIFIVKCYLIVLELYKWVGVVIFVLVLGVLGIVVMRLVFKVKYIIVGKLINICFAVLFFEIGIKI